MTPLEIARGWVTGAGDPVRLAVRSAPPVLQAFEDAIRPALQRPPCLLEFSGGRDSSAVLAVACSLARREAHAPPIPVTLRFPGVTEADEEQWQAGLIRELGITEWVRRDIRDEWDLIGPFSGPSLRRHGMIWPPLAHGHGAIWELARGGSVVTGEGGDEVLGARRLTPLRQLLAGDVKATPSNIRVASRALAPRQVRAKVLAASFPQTIGANWLLPSVRADFLRDTVEGLAKEPFNRTRALAEHLASRSVRVSIHNMALMASTFDVALYHPMLDTRFVAAIASTGRLRGPRDRAAAMRSIFGDLLPEEWLSRTTKARFNRVHFGVHSRAFIEEFNGEGVDLDLVDPEELLKEWRAPSPNALTSALLQSAWLASSAGRP